MVVFIEGVYCLVCGECVVVVLCGVNIDFMDLVG